LLTGSVALLLPESPCYERSMTTNLIAKLSDGELLSTISKVANDERRVTVELLKLLGEVDARRLYLGESCSSLFAYCTQVLHFSEHAAYHRIHTARVARSFPVILEFIADGSLTPSSVTVLRPHLTLANHLRLLMAARNKTRRAVEYQVACLAPKREVEPLVRRLPERMPEDRDRAELKAGTPALPNPMVLSNAPASSDSRFVIESPTP
jgi:hypothetical protein